MESVQVDIYGQVYTLKATDDPSRIRAIASFVDGRMREIEKGTGTVDPHRVAMLTVLTLADELFRVRERCDRLEAAGHAAAERLLDLTAEQKNPG